MRMTKLTLMPTNGSAVAEVVTRRATVAHVQSTSGMPSFAGRVCRWSDTSAANAIHTALKAYGSRRLGETST